MSRNSEDDVDDICQVQHNTSTPPVKNLVLLIFWIGNEAT